MRRFFWLSMWITLMLAGIVGWVGARAEIDPHDRVLVGQFFAVTPGCLMPCWNGIRPGTTTLDQAVERLHAHPWISPQSISALRQMTGISLTWTWRDDAPAFVHNPALRTPPHAWLTGADPVVQYILLPTLIPFSQVWELYGRPQSGYLSVRRYDVRLANAGRPNSLHNASYFDGGIVFDTNFSCPARAADFWDAPVRITLYAPRQAPLYRQAIYSLPERLYRYPCRI